MSKQANSEKFYNKLREQLYETNTWPAEYLYKFIVLSSSQSITKIETIFDNMGAVINTKESSNGKYTSISINLLMKDPNIVIEKYKEVALKVEGVISL